MVGKKIRANIFLSQKIEVKKIVKVNVFFENHQQQSFLI